MWGWSRIVGVMALLLFPFAGAAPAEEAPAAANPSLIAHVRGVDDAAHVRSLKLDRFMLDVRLRGSVAETTVTATFANPLSEILEGDFRFQLPAGAVVTGYALDIGGKLVDGVLVDRPRARAVYAERVRAGVDPGLGEVRRDGLFETHVFPIPPGGGRTIRLRFVTAIGAGGYALPLAIDAPAHGWTVSLAGSDTEASAALTLPDGRLLHLAAALAVGKHEIRFEGTGPVSGTLGIAASATVPDLVVSRHASGERDAELGGALPAGAATHPTRVRVYWDRARGHKGSRHEAEIALVARWLDAVRPQAIELVAFNSSGALRHDVASGAQAARWLGDLSYRGATSLAAIAHDGPADQCLLIGAGAPTIDRDATFAPGCRLDVVSADAAADTGWLAHLATAHGGQAFRLTASGDTDAVLQRLTAVRPGVSAVTDQDGAALPFVPLDAAPGNWRILARAPEGGPLLVRIGGETRRVTVDGEGTAFDGAGALIANGQLATLTATERRADYLSLSRRYDIASPSLSFLVLEIPQDYLDADVTPPDNYPAALRADYNRAFKARASERDEAKRERLARVVHDWGEEVAWWNKPFDVNARPERIATSRNFDRTEAAAPPPPPPPPLPLPLVAMPQMASPSAPALPGLVAGNRARQPPEAADVVVTGSKRRGAGDAEDGPAIEIDAWQPNRPYLELYDGKPAAFDERFLEAEARHGGIPAFYLDTAEWLRKHGRAGDAAEMVLSALDLPSANEVTLGIVADRLERYGQIDRAIELRTRQAALDPEHPQPKRLLALALARRAALQPARARADLTRAIRLLGEVAVAPNDERWDGIDMISLVEANALVPRLRALGGKPDLDPRLVTLLDTDIRVVVDWSTDGSDLDLWVDEPTGERSIYNNPLTAIGGHLSNDMTQGYGPEEYLLHRAKAGTYIVQANVFAPDRLDPNGASVLTAHLFRNFGRPNQQEQVVDVELTEDSEGSKMLGRIVVPAARKPAR